MCVFGDHLKNCTERLKRKLKEIQYQLKRLQAWQHLQLCSVDYLAYIQQYGLFLSSLKPAAKGFQPVNIKHQNTCHGAIMLRYFH